MPLDRPPIMIELARKEHVSELITISCRSVDVIDQKGILCTMYRIYGYPGGYSYIFVAGVLRLRCEPTAQKNGF